MALSVAVLTFTLFGVPSAASTTVMLYDSPFASGAFEAVDAGNLWASLTVVTIIFFSVGLLSSGSAALAQMHDPMITKARRNDFFIVNSF